jgi:aspartyl-tRNA(Asn)/glutamyl-tRNA(Gln) amidotransferase subunit A
VTAPGGRSVTELAAAIRAGELSAIEVTDASLEAIRARDGRVNAFVTVTADDARAAARAADEARSRGRAGPLAGVPVAVKDLLAVRGVVRTNGTAACADDAPAIADAAVVARLRAAGAVVVGTTHLHELAFGPTGVNPMFGTPTNPWGAGRMPGGSSSGSGAAVAAGLVPVALGTDTGGSIRVPSSFCGLSGLKPTFGRVSRAGLTPLAWSLDHIGPIARTVRDLAFVLQVLAGHDPADAASARVPVADYAAALDRPARSLRVGVPRDFVDAVIDADVAGAFDEALGELRRAGAVTVDVAIPTLALSTSMLGAVILAEAASAHGALLARAGDRLGLETRVYLELGKTVTARQYLAAQRLRTQLHAEMRDVLTTVDVLVTPTTPLPAPRIEELGTDTASGLVERICRLTGPFNLSGLPALSVPCGFSRDGLPIGLQLVGRPFAEADLLAAGESYQRLTDWHLRRPPS